MKKSIYILIALVFSVGLLTGGYQPFALSQDTVPDPKKIAAGPPGIKGNQALPGIYAIVLEDQPSNLLYQQPPSATGGLFQSSWWDPNGSDYDQYVWDDFTLSLNQAISEIAWRGGYDPSKVGSGGPVLDFTVSIYASIPAGTQPDVVNPPLVRYQTGGNAGEVLASTFGGTTMYNYEFILPKPFQAVAGTKYWTQIEATQHGIPDWGIAAGTGGDGKYFRRIAAAGDIYYQVVSGDSAFSLK